MKHTPGPWTINHTFHEEAYADDELGVYVLDFVDPDLLETDDPATAIALNQEHEANKTLIEAAPRMLACLKNLRDRDLIKDTDGDHYDEVLDAITAAEEG